MIAPKVTFEAHVISLSLSWESLVVLHDLVRIRVLARVFLDVLYLLIELVLEHTYCVNGMLKNIVCKL